MMEHGPPGKKTGLRALQSALWLAAALSCVGASAPTTALAQQHAAAGANHGEVGQPDQGLRYREVILGDAPASIPLPTIIALHPWGGGPRGFGRRFHNVRMPCPVRLVLPFGPLRYGSGYAWMDVAVAAPETSAQLAADTLAATDRLAALIDALDAADKMTGPPLVTGFSQGAVVAMTLAARHPNRTAAVFPVAGLIPVPLQRSHAAPSAATAPPNTVAYPTVEAWHGTADTLVPFASGAASIRFLAAQGAHATLHRNPGAGHTFDAATRRALFRALARAVAGLCTHAG